MSERLKYVSPEYQSQLDHLAETLVTAKRFGGVALDDTVEMQLSFDLPDNIEIGEN